MNRDENMCGQLERCFLSILITISMKTKHKTNHIFDEIYI